MLSKEQFLASLETEHQILNHLGSKVDANQLEYRPSDTMRTTLELMRYLTFCGVAPARAVIQNDWSVVGEYQAKAQEMAADQFENHLKLQFQEIHNLLEPVSARDLVSKEANLPWGVTTQLGAALVDTTLKFLTSYRLQLFCYLKASGNSELSTYNAWIGIDKPEQ